jgi:hypothetical protein
LALTPSSDEAFVREVDEELRRDEILQAWKRWGRWVIGAVVGGLMVFGGILWWRQHQADVAAEQGEKMSAAFQDLLSGKQKAATASFDALAASKSTGYRDTAKLMQANLALAKNDLKTAAARFADVANDEAAPKPLRDLALIRQTAVEFDTLKPQTVVDRLRPLAFKGSPWYGSAGEMVALADLRMGRRDQTVRMLREIASDSTVPESIRQRGVQLADVLSTPASAAPVAAAPVEEKQAR